MAKYLLFILFLVSAQLSHTYAQEPKLNAAVSKNNVTIGEQIQVEFSLNESGRNFQAPSFSDFNVLMGPSQSMSTQIINGSISQSITYTYIIQAIKEGTFKIGSASIEVGSKRLVSNPISITVSKGTNQNTQGQQQSRSAGNEEISKNVFLRATVDKSTVYRGEGIVCTYRLYTRVALINYGLNKLPSYNGFWSQEIELPQQLEFRHENFEGISYKVADIKKMVLFPQKTGTLQIEPMEGEVIARVQVKRNRSNDPFDQFFNDPFFNNPFFNNSVQDIKVPLRSQTLNITVKDLPASPADYTGAVGKFSMEVTINKNEVKTHDAVSLKIKINGKGNLKLIQPPTIQFPPGFETYDPKESNNISVSGQGVTGSKTFEYLLIPRNEGEYKIEVNPFSYFNLETKQFQTIPAPQIILSVLKGNGSNTGSASVSSYNKEDIQMLGKDIRFIKTSIPALLIPSATTYPSLAFYTLLIIPAILFIGFLLIRRKRQKDVSNFRALKSKRAGKIARKRLSAAKKYLTSNEQNLFLDEMFKALWGFISDKLQIPVSHLSKESISDALQSKNVAPQFIDNFVQVVDDCELARFAPKGIAKSPEEIYKKGIEIITSLEEQIKI